LLVCNWLHSVGQNHFFVMMHLNSDSAIQSSFRSTIQRNQIPCNLPDDVIYRPDAQLSKASSVRTKTTFRPDLPLCQEASNCSSLHPFERFSITSRQHSRLDMGRSLQPFGRCGFSSERASYIYGNCVHQINRPNDHSLGPYARSLNMEIACN
jgi:hypothetical protein